MSIPIETITDAILAEKGFYWRERDGVLALICAPLENAGFVNGFSTRGGGVSDFPANSLNLAGYDEDSTENISENRRRFLRLFDGDFKLASCWQVHGDEIRFIKDLADADDANYKKDALISSAENVLLGVKTADCVPVLLADVKTRAFAAIHAGWRGTVASIVPKTIREMQTRFGTKPENLVAAIGPAASGNCYEVGADVIEDFAANFPESHRELFTPTRENNAFVDLHLANKQQLISQKVAAENIFTAPFCTMTRTDLFFSYRVEKKSYGKTGRLMSVIGRK